MNNIYSQYIEDFVDQSYSIPRDIIRMSKQIEDLDDMSNTINSKLTENRKVFLNNKRNKADKQDELKEQIDKDYQLLLVLNQQKMDNIKEMEYLCKIHLETIGVVAERYEKDYASENWNIQDIDGLINNHNISGSVYGHGHAHAYGHHSHSHGRHDKNKLKLKYQNSNLNRQGKVRDSHKAEAESENHKNTINNTNEEIYCFCQGVSYGDMVCCENTSCKLQWFHFSCVGLTASPTGKWYCSDLCKDKARKRKKNI